MFEILYGVSVAAVCGYMACSAGCWLGMLCLFIYVYCAGQLKLYCRSGSLQCRFTVLGCTASSQFKAPQSHQSLDWQKHCKCLGCILCLLHVKLCDSERLSFQSTYLVYVVLGRGGASATCQLLPMHIAPVDTSLLLLCSTFSPPSVPDSVL